MATDLAASRIPVEPVSFETLDWKPRAPEMYSRAEVARQTGPYQAAVPAVLAAWSPQIPFADLADIEDTTRGLVEFDQHAHRVLGAENPALRPMAAILLRTESASSSQIEQLTTTAKQLALAEIGESNKVNAVTVLGNVHAMEAALELSRSISEDSILAMHRALMVSQSGFDPHLAGKFRDEQVWIGAGSAGPRRAGFVPPHHARVSAAVADLVRFAARHNVPVIVQVAVTHAQFETIHPFSDGNGRTGRALAQSILRGKGLVRSTAVPISAGLLTDTECYFRALSAFQSGDAGPIIRAFAQTSRFAAVTGQQLVDGLAAQLLESRARLRGLRADAAAWQVLPLLIGQPAVNTAHLMRELGLSEMTALRALDALASRGVLVESTGRRRGRVWEHRGVLAVLDDYAGRIRRPA